MAKDPTNVWPIANYATFLWDIKKNYIDSEKLYLKVLSMDEFFSDAMINYADFLSEVKNEDDEAEKLYLKTLKKYPDLGNFLKK